jgi:hypothetical protein
MRCLGQCLACNRSVLIIIIVVIMLDVHYTYFDCVVPLAETNFIDGECQNDITGSGTQRFSCERDASGQGTGAWAYELSLPGPSNCSDSSYFVVAAGFGSSCVGHSFSFATGSVHMSSTFVSCDAPGFEWGPNSAHNFFGAWDSG